MSKLSGMMDHLVHAGFLRLHCNVEQKQRYLLVIPINLVNQPSWQACWRAGDTRCTSDGRDQVLVETCLTL